MSASGGWRFAWALYLVAAGLRLAHLATIRSSPFFAHLGLDPLAYDEWGLRIAGGDWIGKRIFYQDPLYPYFLGLVYTLAGHSYTLVIALQGLIGAAVAPLVFLTARRWLDFSAARAAGVLAVLYAPSIYFEGIILKTWMAVILVAAASWLLSSGLDSRRGSWLAAGATLGLAVLVRANILLFFPVLAAWLFLDPVARGQAGGGRPWSGQWLFAKRWGALLLGAAVVLGPVMIRNRIVGGEWVLTTSQGGQNFYIGNNAGNRSGQYEPLPFVGANPKFEESGFAREAEKRTGRPLSAREISRFWFDQSFAWIAEYPTDWLRLTWTKFRIYWAAFEIPDNLDYELYSRSAPLLRLPLPGFALVAPLAFVGAVRRLRRPGWPRLALLLTITYSTSVILFFVFARYRMAMMPLLFPFAGAGLVDLARAWRLTRGVSGATPPPGAGAALRTTLLLLAALLFVNLPVRAPADSLRMRLAERLGMPRVVASSAVGHYNLGLAYAQRAEGDRQAGVLLALAESEFREALRQDDRYAEVYGELGKVLARQERNREAIDVYRKALQIEGGKPRVHHVLGLLHQRLGEVELAAEQYSRALVLDPDRADSAIRLGQIRLSQGRHQEAADLFRRALASSPADAEARAGLAAATAP